MRTDQEIQALVSQMTLEEKAGLCSGKDSWRLKGIPRLGIPEIMVSDGPHGLRRQVREGANADDSVQAVCFPTACATAASFDEALLERLGSALGRQCRAEGVSILLGPAMNCKRSPLCGRNFEYFSEDPCLTGRLASAQVRGIQSWDVGACPKHFAANNQEYRRMSTSAVISRRALREIYLEAFETVVREARPWSMMSSYNRINGVFTGEDPWLLTEILREEWGFDGLVMSDWGAVNRRTAALEAGLDLEMPGPSPLRDSQIVQAVRSGSLQEAVLDRAVERILRIVFRAQDHPHPEARFDREADHRLAAEMAAQCAVLLKNQGVLPLNPASAVAYIGPYAEKPRFQGAGSSHINASKVSDALTTARAKGRRVSYARGFCGDRDEWDESLAQEAVAAARQAEVAVLFAGLPDSFESEGYDRSHMALPDCQNRLIARIAAVQPNTIVVLHNGSPVEMPWADQVRGILELYLGGQGVGEATDALLFGDAEPGGRLPETFPLALAHNPSYLNFPGDGHTVRYAEDVYVGYRYYDKKQLPVRFPFGHGLSYTTFSYQNCRVSAPTLREGETLTVCVDVTNTGRRTGSTVVQLYIRDETGAADRPVRELKGFGKVSLAPGETKTIALPVRARDLCWFSEALNDWYAAPGTYVLELGRSSRDLFAALPVTFCTDRCLPVVIEENTTMGEILAHPALTTALQAAFPDLLARLAPDAERSQAAKEAITEEMIRAQLDSMPLRALPSILGLSQETFDALLAALRKANP